MKGIFFDGKKASYREDLPMCQPLNNEALIKVHLTGVCKTDLEILKGYMDFTGILGHEFVGTVEKGPADLIGQRVVAEINNNCGRCEMCDMDLGKHCPNRSTMGIYRHDGAMAEYVAAPTKNIHIIPDSITDEQAVLIEPLAAAFEPLDRLRISADDNILILGDGRLGLLCAMVMASTNDNVMLVGKHPEKLTVAGKSGVHSTTLENFTPAKKWDVVIEATGCQEGFDLAMRTTRPQGTIVLKSTFAAEGGMNLAPLVIDEITILSSRCGPFDKAIKALARGEINVDGLITARYPLSNGVEALSAAGDGKNLKVLIDVDPA